MSAINEITHPLHHRLMELRQTLAEKFPAMEHKPGGFLETGIPEIDRFESGLRKAAITEICSSPGCGALILDALVQRMTAQGHCLALVDAGRSFDVEQSLPRLLWVLCKDAVQAIKAVDLLLRDGNLSLLILDLQFVSESQLRRIPSTTWHRFQRLIEQNTMAVAILTPQPLVEAAHVRITASSVLSLQAQRNWRQELIPQLHLQFFNRRNAVRSFTPQEALA